MTDKIFSLREGTADDEGFICSTWALGLRHGNELFGMIDEPTYFMNYFKVINALLKKSQITIAALAEDPEIILGYSVAESKKLHFVYVKEAWRRMGIMTALVPPLTKFTHITKIGREIQLKKYPDAQFDPFL